MKYCASTYKTERWKTREVMIGNVGVGGQNPVRIQSMTTSPTRDVEATLSQAMRLADQGCEIVRVTVQGIKEADACEQIKNGLIQRGYNIPLVADIHFYPPAAMRVADFVDKVRINPGNFVDKRASFKIIDYDDATYAAEIEKIEEKFTPLVEKCKKLKRAIRIGTNHGSLSDRIMNRYGDTPQGMVESAFEFARVCIKNDFHDFLFSMKSSNPQVMILAYRLLTAEMIQRGWNYPLHLGVTEAGLGEDGRIKSAMGIGSLLLDGLGDTIRVSLTEDPWHEIDSCRRLINLAEEYVGKGVKPFVESYRHFENLKPRTVAFPKNLSLHPGGAVLLKSATGSVTIDGNANEYTPLRLHESALRCKVARLAINPDVEPRLVVIGDEPPTDWERLLEINPTLILLAPTQNRLHTCRLFFNWLQNQKITTPVILNFDYDFSKEDLIIRASAECGALLTDGLGNGVLLNGPYDADFLKTISFGILQAARMRMVKTDFISCPSCGRTLFDLQDVTKRIKARTDHLPGVKIAIMGCIVNGPGEMADADFGYVGSKPGKIDLYIGKECVEKDVDFSDADEKLIELIKAEGQWLDA